jgi:hypothetical protein
MEANNRTLDLGCYTFRLEELPKYRFLQPWQVESDPHDMPICAEMHEVLSRSSMLRAVGNAVGRLACAVPVGTKLDCGRVTDAAGNPSG